MPELPEMETYKTLLKQRLVNQRISGIDVQREKSINVSIEDFVRTVQSSSVADITRRAKHLVFRLDNGHVLLLHLMLGGWMFYGLEREKPDRTTQVVLSFGERSLYFIGLRLGYLHLLTESEANRKLSLLGPEPTDPAFNAERFASRLRRKRGVLKPAFTDQKTIAGIGNCYADEICFAAGILPTRQISSLTEAELGTLYSSMHTVLQQAVRFGGYMEQPLFPGDALTGGFDTRCAVYDRGGEPCVKCGSPIVQDEIASRKAFYCVRCQR